MLHQSEAMFASVWSFPKEQWYRAGIFFFSPPLPLSFFRPLTYREGYYLYSPQSSTVKIKDGNFQVATTTILWIRTTQNMPALQSSGNPKFLPIGEGHAAMTNMQTNLVEFSWTEFYICRFTWLIDHNYETQPLAHAQTSNNFYDMKSNLYLC